MSNAWDELTDEQKRAWRSDPITRAALDTLRERALLNGRGALDGIASKPLDQIRLDVGVIRGLNEAIHTLEET